MATTRSITCGVGSVGLTTVRPQAGCGKPPLPTISLVIPTRNEAGNVQELAARIERASTGISTEILFVDDSDDETPEVIRDVSQGSRLSVSLIHRPPDQRGNGLGGAVVEGMRVASGHWVCVMDADLQHPPELIPTLLNIARDEGADIVVASRYTGSGEAPDLGPMRLAASRLSSFAARLLFPGRIRNVSDSLSGFFLVRRGAIDPDILRPRGFKILFEILVRFPDLNVAEVPFHFQTRYSGESKMSLREGLRYVTLLLDLRFGTHL
jgi:dolichol-phosphate mannosyltransferase